MVIIFIRRGSTASGPPFHLSHRATMIAETLHTPRLTLVPGSTEHVQAELEGRAAFAALIGAAVPESWPPGEYDEAAQRFFLARLLAGGSEGTGWYGWYAIRQEEGAIPSTVVAIAGYYGPPSADGVVEIGYSVCPEWRGQGYATEFVRALTEHAVREGCVTRILAHAFADNPASVRVLERCGYTRLGRGTEPGVFRFAYAPGALEG